MVTRYALALTVLTALCSGALGCGAASQETLVVNPTDVPTLPPEEPTRVEAFLAGLEEADLSSPERDRLLIGSGGFAAQRTMFSSTVDALYRDGDTSGGLLSGCIKERRETRGETQAVRLRADECPADPESPDAGMVSGVLEFYESTTPECGLRRRIEWAEWRVVSPAKCTMPGESETMSYTLSGSMESDDCEFSLEFLANVSGPTIARDSRCELARDFAFSYEGSRRDEPGMGRVFEGRGVYGIEGLGRVQTETESELIHDAELSGSQTYCQAEAMSGTTRVRAGGHTLEVRYDGASAPCTEAPEAPIFIDGVAAGVTQSACSASSVPGGSWVFVLMSLVFLRARTRRV